MSYAPKYTKGDWLAVCDICGRLYEASKLRQRWDNLMCCPHDYEERQPQDFVRGVADLQTVPWSRPEGLPGVGGTDSIVLQPGLNGVAPLQCSTRSSIAGANSAGCMIAGYNKFNYPPFN